MAAQLHSLTAVMNAALSQFCVGEYLFATWPLKSISHGSLSFSSSRQLRQKECVDRSNKEHQSPAGT